MKAPFLCPQCSRDTQSPLGERGVCLRCAGKSALLLDLDEAVAEGGMSAADAVPLAAERVGSSPPLGELPRRIGPYEIIDEIGRGGMGRIFAARQPRLDRLVALKALATGPANEALEQRFLREIQTVARLRHPNIVAVHDSGRADGFFYFTMDYITGGDLARRHREQPLGLRTLVAIMAKIAGALAYAHGEGIIHRDLKSSNILLDGDDPRLADFGLAAQLDTGGDLTAVSGVLGTPHYLAPEVFARGSSGFTPASDLYAMGVILYAAIAGRTPFGGAMAAELPALLENSEPPPLRLLAPATPRNLETICLKCLERDPARRYVSAAQLAEDLRRWLAGEPILAHPPGAWEQFRRLARRHRMVLGVATGTGLALAAGTAVSTTLAVRARRAEHQAAAEAARANEAMSEARRQLRAAKVSEARSVRQTTNPGRRGAALAALREAAAIAPGADLRREAVAALLLPELQLDPRRQMPVEGPAAIFFAPDGRRIVREMRQGPGVEGRGNYELVDGESLRSIAWLESGGVPAIAAPVFGAGGRLAAARCADGTVRVWRLDGGALVATLRGLPVQRDGARKALWGAESDFSPDGQIVVHAIEPRGLAWHALTEEREIGRCEEGGCFTQVSCSPDGRWVAAIDASSYEERRMMVYEMASHRLARTATLRAAPAALAWTPDSRCVLVASADNALASYDVARGATVQALQTTERAISAALPVVNGRLVALECDSSKVAILDAATGRMEFELGDTGPGGLWRDADGQGFFQGTMRNAILHWRVDGPVGGRVLPPGRQEGYYHVLLGNNLDFSADGSRVYGVFGRFVTVRDTESGRLLGEFDLGEYREIDDSTLFLIDGDGRLLVGSQKEGLSLLRVAPDAAGNWHLEREAVVSAESGMVLAAATTDRSRVALLGAVTGAIRVLERRGAGFVELSRWSAPSAYACAFSPDGGQLLVNYSGLDPTVPDAKPRVFSVRDGAVLRELSAAPSSDTAWSRDGSCAMTSNGQNESVLWDARTWTVRTRIVGAMGGNTTGFALSPDGAHAAIAHGDTVNLVSTTDGTSLLELRAPGAPSFANCVRFLPDGRRFAVLWPDGRIDLYEPDLIFRRLEELGF